MHHKPINAFFAIRFYNVRKVHPMWGLEKVCHRPTIAVGKCNNYRTNSNSILKPLTAAHQHEPDETKENIIADLSQASIKRSHQMHEAGPGHSKYL